MNKLFMQLVKTRREALVSEEDLAKMLKVLNRNRIRTNMDIGDCEWGNERIWYITFSATDRQMVAIKSELKKGDFREILILEKNGTWGHVEKLG